MSDELKIGDYVVPTESAKGHYPPLSVINKPVKIVGQSPDKPSFFQLDGVRARWHKSCLVKAERPSLLSQYL